MQIRRLSYLVTSAALTVASIIVLAYTSDAAVDVPMGLVLLASLVVLTRTTIGLAGDQKVGPPE
jgi:tetrahydromethanopterin S-methyltransferase subunit E